MPAFQKIGGLLSNSTTTDTATLHDAVIAINQAVMDKVCLNSFKQLCTVILIELYIFRITVKFYENFKVKRCN